MPDDKTKRRPQDSSRIAMHEPYEVNWWCGEFGCSRAELQTAVNAVGHGADAVREHFRRNPPRG
jgi:hypothetical protein